MYCTICLDKHTESTEISRLIRRAPGMLFEVPNLLPDKDLSVVWFYFRMVNEDIKSKKKILDSLEYHTKLALKLSKELGER